MKRLAWLQAPLLYGVRAWALALYLDRLARWRRINPEHEPETIA